MRLKSHPADLLVKLGLLEIFNVFVDVVRTNRKSAWPSVLIG